MLQWFLFEKTNGLASFFDLSESHICNGFEGNKMFVASMISKNRFK